MNFSLLLERTHPGRIDYERTIKRSMDVPGHEDRIQGLCEQVQREYFDSGLHLRDTHPAKGVKKRCCKCQKTKPIDNFYKDKGQKDGFQAKCQDCQKVYMKRYYMTDKGKAAQARARALYIKTDKFKEAQRRANKKYLAKRAG